VRASADAPVAPGRDPMACLRGRMRFANGRLGRIPQHGRYARTAGDQPLGAHVTDEARPDSIYLKLGLVSRSEAIQQAVNLQLR